MEVLARPRAISSETLNYVVPEGSSIDDLLTTIQWDRVVDDHTVVMIDGLEIDRRYWRAVKPKPGCKVTVNVRLAGGGGGGGGSKQILTAVATLAIVVAAAYFGPQVALALAPELFTGGVIAGATAGGSALAAGITAGIAITGTLLLGAFVRPPALANRALTSSPDAGAAPSEGSVYSVSGSSNSISRYGVVPKLFGRARMTPHLIAEPYVIAAGPLQTLRLLLDFGHGPLLIEDINIGTTPISAFPTARFIIHPYFRAGDPLHIYTYDNSTLSVGAVLAEFQNNIRVVPQSSNRAFVDIGFPGGLVETNEQGMNFDRTEIIHIYYRDPALGGSHSPIGDIPHWAFFSGTSGADISGERFLANQLPGWAQRSSRMIAWYVAGSELPETGDRVDWNGYGYTVTNVGPVVLIPGFTVDSPGDWRSVYLDGDLPPFIPWASDWILQPGWDQPYPSIFRRNFSASVGPLTVGFGPHPVEVVFSGRTRVPRTISIAMSFPYEAMWEILVVRATPVSSNQLIANQITWTALRGERNSSPAAPRIGHTIMELEVAATEQINGQIANINALVTSVFFDPRNGGYPATRNPALAYANLLTDASNKRAIRWDQLDLPKIIQWANWCEGAAPQGDQRATCDLVVEQRSSVAEIAQTICAAGRAVPAMINGLYSVLMEAETRLPVQMLTHRNTKSMTASRVWADEPHAIKVRFLSEATWEREEIFVYNDGYDANNATLFETLDLIGTTRGPQAWRMGRYYLAQVRLRKETMEVEMDIENLVCQRGDLVLVAHDSLLNSTTARCVPGQFGNRVFLDSNIETTPTHAQIRRADGVISPIVPVVGVVAPDQVQIGGGWATQTAPGDLISFGILSTVHTPWIVDSVTPGGDLSAKLKLIEQRPEINNSDSGAIPPYVPPNSASGALTVLTPVRDGIVIASPGFQVNDSVNFVLVDWNPPIEYVPAIYLVERTFRDDVRQFIGRTEDTSYRDVILSLGIPPGGEQVLYYITPVSASGRRGQTTELVGTVLPDLTAPSKPILSANVMGETTRLLWETVPEPDLSHYQIRWTSDFANTNWNEMQIMVEFVSAETNLATFHTRTGLYAIKAIDRTGNWSESSFVTTLVDMVAEVDVSYTIQGPPWNGTFTNCELDGDGNLVLTKDARGFYHREGFFQFTDDIALDRVWGTRIQAEARIDAMPPGVESVTHDAQVMLSLTKDLPLLNSPWFSPLSTAVPLAGDPTNFGDWTTVFREWMDGKLFQVGVQLRSLDGVTTPVVKSAKAELSFDLRTEYGNDVDAPGGVLEVVYAHSFIEPANVQLTLNNGQPGDHIRRIANTLTGFRMEIRSSANALVSGRIIDWSATGQGIGL